MLTHLLSCLPDPFPDFSVYNSVCNSVSLAGWISTGHAQPVVTSDAQLIGSSHESSDSVTQEGSLRYNAINLYDEADHGHLQLIGPMLSPGAPGWHRLSSSTQLSRTFREPEVFKGKTVSWVEGHGATITFPVSESEHPLEELLIWIHPVAPHQVVSLFIDEELIKNLSLSYSGRFYRLKLSEPLTQGEHSLRLYFRFTRPAPWGGRTPGAIGPLSFVPRGQREEIPERWVGEIVHDQRKWGAIFAPPPATWRFYFFPPNHASLRARLYLPPFAPKTRFQVFAATDTINERLVFTHDLESGHGQDARSKEVEVNLKEFIGQATRLTLKTQKLADHPLARQRPRKAREAITQVGWLAPRVESLYPTPRELPRVKRLIIWSLDGLKLERLFSTPELIETLPSLKLIMRGGIRFTRLWSDNARAQRRGQALLSSSPSLESLVSKVKRAGGRSVYIGSTTRDVPTLDVNFDQIERVDPNELEDHPYRVVLTQVQQISRVGSVLHDHRHAHSNRELTSTRSQAHPRATYPELIYLHALPERLGRRKHPFNINTSERAWIESLATSKYERRALNLWLRRLKELDYCLSLLLSELSFTDQRDETALLIVGGSGTPHKLTTPKAMTMRSHIETSALYYHPKLTSAKLRQVIDRAHISALRDTIAHTLITPELLDQERERGSLAPFIFSGAALPPLVDYAQRSSSTLTRIQDYYLFERPHSSPKLWRVSADQALSAEHNLIHQSPILLRTLRDRIMMSSLFQGLADIR